MEEENQDEYCEKCGAKVVVYTYKLLPVQVNALIKFSNAIRLKGENDVHLTKEIDHTPNELTRSERTNWTQVHYHGLVKKVRQESGRQKRGCWAITRKGRDFLQGTPIPLNVKIFRKKVQGFEMPLVTITEVMGMTPYVQTIDDIVYEPLRFNEEGQGELF